jgi:hypothetical protein
MQQLRGVIVARFHMGLLSFGVFLIMVAVWVAAFLLETISAANLVPLILLSSGVWTVAIAGIKAANQKEDGAFSTFGWGMLLTVIGGSFYMVNMGMNPVYIVVFVLALLGALAIAAALKSGRL